MDLGGLAATVGAEVTDTRPSGLVAKMAQLMYVVEVAVLTASGLRAEDWKPSSTAEGLACPSDASL